MPCINSAFAAESDRNLSVTITRGVRPWLFSNLFYEGCIFRCLSYLTNLLPVRFSIKPGDALGGANEQN